MSGPILAVNEIKCPFSKDFQFLYIFAQIFKYFALFCPLSGTSHTCPYVLHHKEHKNGCDTLFLIYIYIYIYIYIAKILSTSYFGYFGHIQPLPSKKIIPTCTNLDAYLHVKMNSIPNF